MKLLLVERNAVLLRKIPLWAALKPSLLIISLWGEKKSGLLHESFERLESKSSIPFNISYKKSTAWTQSLRKSALTKLLLEAKQRCLHELSKVFHGCIYISFPPLNLAAVWLLTRHQLDRRNDLNKSQPTDKLWTASRIAPRKQTHVDSQRAGRANAKWIYICEHRMSVQASWKGKIT